MEVKAGYKMTAKLKDLVTFASGGTPPKRKGNYWDGQIPWVSAKDMKSPRLSDTEDHLSELGAKNGTKIAPAGAILVLVRGMTLHKDIPLCIVERPMAFNQDVKSILSNNTIDQNYLFYWLLSIKSRLLELVDSSTHGTGRLPLNDVINFDVPLPPLSEQRAIAEALSDADANLAALEALITKKRAVKQGAMHDLLSGKRRLDGFATPISNKQTEVGAIPQDWDVVRIMDILRGWRLGGNYANKLSKSEYPLIKMGNVGRGTFTVADTAYIHGVQTICSDDRLRYGDVLFNTRNTLELVGKVAVWRDELPLAYFNSNLLRLDFNERVGSSFLISYLLNTQSAVERLARIATGTTSVAAIYTRDLLSFPIPLPPVTEQVAIAAVLMDMDAEILAHEAKLAKALQIKAAMMQQLLTGRIRLI